jgi:hypothetical protein
MLRGEMLKVPICDRTTIVAQRITCRLRYETEDAIKRALGVVVKSDRWLALRIGNLNNRFAKLIRGFDC